MKKAALFPFNKTLLPIVRHFQELQMQYELTEVIALPGMGLAGKDVGVVCNQPSIGIQVVDELDAESDKWDILILVREYLPTGFDEQGMVKNLLSCMKELIILEHSKDCIPQWLLKLDREEELLKLVVPEALWEKEVQTTGYEGIQTPVLLIGGVVEEADVLEVTVMTTKILKDMGFVVATVTKESAAGIFDFLDFKSLYSKCENEAEKIIRLNHTLQLVEKEIVPDIIIIEAPDALIRYNDLAPNGFGIQTYMLCQAVQIDFMVCCMPYDLAQMDFLKLLNQDFSLRYGVEIDIVHASNVLVDSVDLINSKYLSVFNDVFDKMETFIMNTRTKTAIPVCNVISHTEQFGKYLQSLLESGEYIDEE
ncbi:MAG: hypothetical protein NC489_30510 [Ruminococcus flavefaciens]|nr:hypothetical protein [Roseburia sp.]MCM1234455.1 hypothetical protein [Ruminococcus flavefaciens]